MKLSEIVIPDNWKLRTVRELGNGSPNTVQTGPFGSQLHSDDYVEDGVPLLLIRNMQDGRINAESLPRVDPSDAKRLNRYCLVPGDIVFSRVGRVGSCFHATTGHNGWLISGQLLRVRISNDAIDNGYIYRALISDHAQRCILGESVGTTRTSINTKILESLLVLLPQSKHEQGKIAEILSTVDRAIEQTEALIAKQERIKTGLMQDLLTHGIDENGNLRSESTHQFKDSPLGRIPVEWDPVSLGSVSEFVTSGSRGWARYYSNDGVIFVRIGNLTRRHINLRLDDLVFVNPPQSSEGKRTAVETGDLLISITADLGIIGVVPSDFGEAYVNQHVALVRLKQEEVNPRFIGWFLSSRGGQRQFESLNESGAKAGINLPTMGGLIVPRTDPESLEQDRIAEILDKSTEKMDEYLRRMIKLRSIKTALMQDLLTGRKRVTPLLEMKPVR